MEKTRPKRLLGTDKFLSVTKGVSNIKRDNLVITEYNVGKQLDREKGDLVVTF